MPSIIPSYVYTLFACIAVGALLIYASSLSSISVKNEADLQELKNIADYVAATSFELVSSTQTNNLTANLMLSIPSTVGNQRYWVQLDNDSFRSWVNIGFGTTPQTSGQRTYIPSEVSAFGDYVSGAGIPVLRCYSDGSATYLEISEGA
ncbi:MAG: hypothetical protein WCD81_05070 [Candidatus Bathyarchaeia archaeon]